MQHPQHTRLALAAALLSAFPGGATAQQDDSASATYAVLVAAESSDEVYRVRFDGSEAEVVGTIPVGVWPLEIEGPHGLAVEPDGSYWYLSLAHGTPFGHVLKFDAETDEQVGAVEVGLFPATMDISPATGLLYCVNFDLHGDMTPSSVSVVDTEAMVEVARTETGAMPHGSRVSSDGLKHYSCAMMSGKLFELDATTFEVLRVIDVVEAAKTLPRIDTSGNELPREHDLHGDTGDAAGSGDHGHGGAKAPKPTWVQPHPLLPFAYVALNGIDEILEVDLETWEVTRRFATPRGPYNLAITPDGAKLVVTYKGDGSVGFWDLRSGAELGRAETTRTVTHGVVVSPDGQYAFVTSEGVGSEPGALDVFYLESYSKIATAEVGLQAGGVALLPAPSDG